MLGKLRQYMALQMLKVTVRTALDTFPADKLAGNAELLSAEFARVEAAAVAMSPVDFEADLTSHIVEAYQARHSAMQARGETRKDPAWNLAHMQETWLGARLALLKSPQAMPAFERIDALLRDFIAQTANAAARS